MLSKSKITTGECAQKVVKGRKFEPIEKKGNSVQQTEITMIQWLNEK